MKRFLLSLFIIIAITSNVYATQIDDRQIRETYAKSADLSNYYTKLQADATTETYAYSKTVADNRYIPKSTVTTTGDLIIGNGSSSVTRLAIGTNTYVLTSNGTTAAWAAPSGGLPTQTSNANKYLVTDGTNASWQGGWYLIGTASPSSGASFTLASSISTDFKMFKIEWYCKPASNALIGFQFNSDTGNNYRHGLTYITAAGSTASSFSAFNQSRAYFADASQEGSMGVVYLNNFAAGSYKNFHGTNGYGYAMGPNITSSGSWQTTGSKVTSIVIITDGANFSEGYFALYGML